MTGFELEPVFVFGSNREGRHGKGAALQAIKAFGAIYGQAEGRQGRAYAIVTKELRPDYPEVTITEIARGVKEFLQYARLRPKTIFLVSPVGCGLAGFTAEKIAPFFEDITDNVRLPQEFIEVLRVSAKDRNPFFQTARNW